ncbi:hypothetical protein J5X84_31805 [Streptosporangiaceae bacterium NEAU-GS5]|nr:hypothetical protein [Streptosporangiaceae bacterium NEAU-GS5]
MFVLIAVLGVVLTAGAPLTLALIAWAIRREDQRGTTTDRAPGALAWGTRRLTGFTFRNTECDIHPNERQEID